MQSTEEGQATVRVRDVDSLAPVHLSILHGGSLQAINRERGSFFCPNAHIWSSCCHFLETSRFGSTSMLLPGLCRPFGYTASALGAPAKSGLATVRGLHAIAHGVMPVRAPSQAPEGFGGSQAAAHVQGLCL